MKLNWKVTVGLVLIAAMIFLRIYVSSKTSNTQVLFPPVKDGMAKGMESMRLSALTENLVADNGVRHKIRSATPISLLVSANSGSFLRIGLESALNWSKARHLATHLETASALEVDAALASSFVTCPREAAAKEPVEDKIHLISPKEKIFLICAPKARCTELTADAKLRLRSAVQADELKLGELFDVAWPEALCFQLAAKSPPPPPVKPFAIAKVFVTVD